MRTIPHLRELTGTLRTLELSGKYLEAFECASDVWKSIDEWPDIRGLDAPDAGDLLLRCGKLAGLMGRTENRIQTQDNAKNLLTRAREIFLEIGNLEGIVEAENAIALAYMRKGEFREAEVWIDSSLDRDLAPTSFARVESFVCKSLILSEAKRYEDVVKFLKSVEPFFNDFDDDYLNGCFATNLGIAYRNLGQLSASMQMYSLARYYHKKSGHLGYLATVENNLAYLYKEEGRFGLALKCIDRALELHKEVGDLSRLGFTYDSKADMFLAQGKHDEALEAIETGLKILRKTEFTEYLIEGLLTKIKILARQGRIAQAAISFSEAAGHASAVQGEVRVNALAEEFESLIKHSGFCGLGKIFTQRIISGENLELLLPPSLTMFSSFDGVWINNSDLEKVGLSKGSLALLVSEVPARDDLVAVVEKGCEDVICGYFDKDYGIIAISDDFNSEPQIFSEDAVEILGKIVGFANPEDRQNGKLIVKPIMEH